MILLFINIRKVPREMLKASLGTLRMLMTGKSLFDPNIIKVHLRGKFVHVYIFTAVCPIRLETLII